MAIILVARTESEKLIFLQGLDSREDLRAMREAHTFYCPDCGNLVLLKIGDIKIPHFSHKTLTDCVSNEPESSKHLQGKLVLHEFFKKKGLPVVLEKYLPKIRQRADLLVSPKTAIEFQCSPVSASEIANRSAAYSSLGLNFVWISGNTEQNINCIQIIKLMEYQKEMFLGDDIFNYLILLNPATKKFQYFSNLFYISGNRWVGKVSILPVEKQSFPFAIPKIILKKEFVTACTIFENARSSFIRSQLFTKKRYQNPVWLLCYKLQLNMRDIPEYIGVPILGAECFIEHPVVWQLRAFQAYKQKLSIETILEENEIKLQKKYTMEQAVFVLGDYYDYLERYTESDRHTGKSINALYDIYCKSVRKLRK